MCRIIMQMNAPASHFKYTTLKKKMKEVHKVVNGWGLVRVEGSERAETLEDVPV